MNFFFICFVLAGSQFTPSSATIFANFKEKIAAGDINAVQSLIKSNQKYIENDSVKRYRNDGFLLAVEKRHAPVVELLLQNGNIDAAAKKNKAIRLASANGDVDMVKILLARPEVDPGAIGNEALAESAKNGHNMVAAFLTHST